MATCVGFTSTCSHLIVVSAASADDARMNEAAASRTILMLFMAFLTVHVSSAPDNTRANERELSCSLEWWAWRRPNEDQRCIHLAVSAPISWCNPRLNI